MKKEALFSIETDKIYLSLSKARAGAPHSLLSPIPIPGYLKIKALCPDVKFEELLRAGCPTEASKLPELQIGPRLYEQSDYYIFMCAKEKGSKVGIYHRDHLIESSFNIDDNGNILHGFINFGSQIGKSEFIVSADGFEQFAFEVEVFPSKLNYASDCFQMISEVQDILTGLALEYLSSTYQLGIGTQTPQPSHVEWLVLLKNIVDDLEGGLLYIARQPV